MIDFLQDKEIRIMLGIIGFSYLLLMLLYSLRKRFFSWGKISSWLNFHIACGIIGTTLIILHSNFNITGLVAICFWSLIVTFISGIIGRYLLSQPQTQKIVKYLSLWHSFHLPFSVAMYLLAIIHIISALVFSSNGLL